MHICTIQMCSQVSNGREADEGPRWDHHRVTRLIAPLVALLLLVVGCGGGGSSATSPSASPVASVSVGPVDTPAPTASDLLPSGAPSGLALPHDDPDLEARLPDEVDGTQLLKLSVGPVSSAGNVGAEPVRALAREIGDGSGNFGLAFANDATRDPAWNIFALRIPGADATELLDRYTGLTVADTPGSETDAVTLAGRGVVRITAPGNPIGDVWIYTLDDTLFGVQAGSQADAERLLALLP